MAFRLTPHERGFYPLFTRAAENIATTADCLAELVGTEAPHRAELARAIKNCEHLGDELTHEILVMINKTFVTPFDREDIYRLAGALDDVLDAMEEAADRIVLYRLDTLPPGVAGQVEVLRRAAGCTATAMPKLEHLAELEHYSRTPSRASRSRSPERRSPPGTLLRGSRPACRGGSRRGGESPGDGAGQVAQRVHRVDEAGGDGRTGHPELLGGGLVLGQHRAPAVVHGPDPGLRIVSAAGQDHGQDARAAGHRESGQQQVRGRPRRWQLTTVDQPETGVRSGDHVGGGWGDQHQSRTQVVAVAGCTHHERRTGLEDVGEPVGRSGRILVLDDEHRGRQIARQRGQDLDERLEPSGGGDQGEHRNADREGPARPGSACCQARHPGSVLGPTQVVQPDRRSRNMAIR